MDSTTRGLSSSSGTQRPNPRTTDKDAVVPLLSPPTLSPVVSDTTAASGPSSAPGGGPEPLVSTSQPGDTGTMPIDSHASCRSTPAQSLRQATIVGSSGAVRAPPSPTTFLEDTAASSGSPQQQPPPLPQPSRGMYPNSRTKPPQRQGLSVPSGGGFSSKPSHAGSRSICATSPATGTRQRSQQHQRFPQQQQGMCSLGGYPPHMMVPPTGHLHCRAPYGVYQDPATMYNCTPQSLQQPQQPSSGPCACSQPQHYNDPNGAAAAAAYYKQCCQFYQQQQQQQGYMYAAQQQQQQAATLASSGGAGPSTSTLMAGHGYAPHAQGGYYYGAGALQKQMMSCSGRGMGPAGHNGFPRGPPSSVGYGGAHYVSNPHSGGDASGDYYASGGGAADVQHPSGRMSSDLTAHQLGSGAYNGEEFFEVFHGTNGFPHYPSGSDALYPKEEPRPTSNGFRGTSIASNHEVPRTNPGEALVGGSSSSVAGVAPTSCVHAAAEGAVPSSRRGSTFLQSAPLPHSVPVYNTVPLGHASSAPISDTSGSARRGGAVNVASTPEVDSESTHPHFPEGEPWRDKDHLPPPPPHGPTGPTTSSAVEGATSPNSLGADALFTPGGGAESSSAPQDPLPVPTTQQYSLRRHPSSLVHHKHHFNLTPAARSFAATVASSEVLMSPPYRSPATPPPALARRRPAPPAAVTPTSLRAMPMHGGDAGFPPDPVGHQRAMEGCGAARHSSGSLSVGAGAASTMPAARRYLTTPDSTGMGGGASKQSGRGGRSLKSSPEIPQQTQSPFSRATVTQSSAPLDPPVGRVSRHSPGTCVVASGHYMTAGSEGTYGGYVSPQPVTYVQSQRGRSTGSLLQSLSGSGSGSVRGLPMGGPAGLLYEHHTGMEVWVEELEASEAPFDPNTFGNAACLVNAISPSVPVKYELEIPATLPDRLPPQQSGQPPDVVVGDAASSVYAAPPTARKPVPGALDTDTAAHPAVRPYADFSGSFFTEPIASLDSIWKSFDLPFGCTVPLARSVFLSRMRAPEDNVVYVPLLSGFRIGFHDASQAYNQLHSLHCERQFTASPVSVDSQTGHMLLTWSASERPDNRNIVLAQVKELTACDAAYSVLLSATTADIDHQSWVAIMWQPVFCGGHSAKQSCGSFLAFYALRAPHHLFLPYAEKSTGAALNSSWRSPVFRIDRAAIFFNIWSFPRAYNVGRPVAGLKSAPSSRHEDLPDNCNKVKGGEGSPATPAPAPRPSSDTGDLRDGTASSGSIRLAVVGLIPNRCRPDVWLVPAMMPMEHGGANGGGGGDGRGGCSWSMRAPLFLLASALQLMAWNAYEEDQRHQRLVADSRQQRRQRLTLAPGPSVTVLETTAAVTSGNKDAQSPPCVAAPSTAIASSMLSRIVQHTLSSNNQFRLAARPTSSSAPPSSTESVLDDVLQSTRSSMLQPCNSSDDILTQPIETVCVSQEYAEMSSAAPPEAGGENGDATLFVSEAQLYAKGVALLKDAALRYRVLRVRAMLDVTGNSTEEVTTTVSPAATHSDAGSGGGSAAQSMGPVIAGGTSAGLCGENGGVIVGLLDFYQWAQYDTALINFAERYCAV